MKQIYPFTFITEKGDKVIKKGNFIFNIYKKVPTNLKFKHISVNDHNQHLCNSWSVLRHINFEEVERVIQGLKPVGINIVSSDRQKEAEEKVKELEKLNLNNDFLITHGDYFSIDGTYKSYAITVSRSGLLKDYFDMNLLAQDYDDKGLDGDVIRKYKDVDFKEFHHGNFDIENHPSEITGLILGYPIENTMSILLYE